MHPYFSDLCSCLHFTALSLVSLWKCKKSITVCQQFWLVGCCLSKFFIILLFPNFLKESKSWMPVHASLYKVFAISSCFYSLQEDLTKTSWAQCKVETLMMMWVLTSFRQQLCSFWSGVWGWPQWLDEPGTKCLSSVVWGVASRPGLSLDLWQSLASHGAGLFFACWCSFLFKWTCLPYFFFLLIFCLLSLSKDGRTTSSVR